MVLVFSSKANLSGHIPKEIERAVSQGITVMPLRIEDVAPAKSLDYFIGSVHWLDALTPPLEVHLQRLAANVQTLLSRGDARTEVHRRPGTCSRERASRDGSGAHHTTCGAAHVGIFRDRRLGRSRADSRLPDVSFQIPAEHGIRANRSVEGGTGPASRHSSRGCSRGRSRSRARQTEEAPRACEHSCFSSSFRCSCRSSCRGSLLASSRGSPCEAPSRSGPSLRG